jgi:hypothetical protein
MKLEYKEIENEDIAFLQQRDEIIDKINKNIIPNKKEINALMSFESKYRVCGGCKKPVSGRDLMISIATVEIKKRTVNVGYFEKCLGCELAHSFFG